jgi:hypothetical protein
VDNFQKYFQDIFNSHGFREWEDAFNKDNIPKNILNKSYFMSYGITTVENSVPLEDNINIVIECFFKGYRNPKEALDNAMVLCNSIRLEILNRESIASFLEVNILAIDSVSQIPEPLNSSNDNSILITLEFNLRFLQKNC